MSDTPAGLEPLCPEAAERAAMTEPEFWERVARNLGQPPESMDDDDLDRPEFGYPDPCVVCGATGSCGFDAEGRPLIHAWDGEVSDGAV